MIDIITTLHKYVPTETTEEEVSVDGEVDKIIHDNFFRILIGS